MSLIQDAKALVRAHYAALEQATADDVEGVLAGRMTSDAIWRAVHPFNVQTGPAGAAEAFWRPFLQSFSSVQRREDIFFAGENTTGQVGTIWTMSMGHLMGLFDAPWLGIPAHGKLVMLRYAEFNQVADGNIVETAFFCDIPHLMVQAGLRPFPDQTAQHLVQPGPRTHDGLLFDPQNADESAQTLKLVERMIFAIDAANRDPGARTPEQELAENWTKDMAWWGPEGIGATYTIPRYIAQHQAPFRRNIGNRVFNGHLCRMAEGRYGGFFGWPNLTVTNADRFMGLPGNDIRADMRVVDIYRRAGDKLAENWIFIDMLHFLKMQGVDILRSLPPVEGTAHQN